MLWKDGKKKALTLSYDDAVIHDRRLIELLNKYGIRCTFNLDSGKFSDEKIDIDYSLTPVEKMKHVTVGRAEVASLYKDHEIASHTVNHPWLNKLTDDEIISEVRNDVDALSDIAGYDVRGFAYPFGAYDERIEEVLKRCGVVYARTVNSTHAFTLPDNYLEWHPTCHHDDEKLFDLAEEFLNSDKEGDIFYLWGHSYEFYMNGNWDRIEKFLKLMSDNKDKIWFATNIEIYDYARKAK